MDAETHNLLRGGVTPSLNKTDIPFRLGILTFHSQVNYGGVLQAFALYRVLLAMGYDVRVIDHWITADNRLLMGLFVPHAKWPRLRLIRLSLLGCGLWADERRRRATRRFLRKYLTLTPYHFFAWNEMHGKELGIDCLVVGSDQVWNADWNDPRPYLLEDAPTNLLAITYAASFGMAAIPEKWMAPFREGFKRFSSIGVREPDGVGLVRSGDAKATHVLDPTQLLSAEMWHTALGLQPPRLGKKPILVCYFMRSYLEPWLMKYLPLLRRFAERQKCRVMVFLDGSGAFTSTQVALRERYPLKALRFAWAARGIEVRRAAGPREFVQAFSEATWLVSDSFHALMFASIFGVEARILRPARVERVKMFSRLTGFAEKYVKGPLFADGLEAALESLAAGPRVTYDEEALAADRERSRAWLRDALERARRAD